MCASKYFITVFNREKFYSQINCTPIDIGISFIIYTNNVLYFNCYKILNSKYYFSLIDSFRMIYANFHYAAEISYSINEV